MVIFSNLRNAVKLNWKRGNVVKNAKLDGPFSERDRDRERQREREREKERVFSEK